jgi:hypothetical protein
MVKHRHVAAAGLIAGVVLASSGCAQLHQLHQVQSAISSAQSAMNSQYALEKANISQWTADKLTQAFSAIDAKIGAHPADYVKISIIKYSVSVQAIDPNKRENVDEYSYDGGDVKVKPVRVTEIEPGAVEQSKFKSDTVNPAVLAQVISSTVKDSGVENGTLDAVTYDRFYADQPEPKITASVEGPRASKVVQYDVTGHLLQIT